MRALLLNTITWILVACGTFLFVRGGLDYWESRSAQNAIASEWNRGEADSTRPGSANPETNVSSAPLGREAARREPQPASRHSEAQISGGARRGGALARLSIPRLNAVLYVVEGDDNSDLKRGPGHLIGSAMPGQEGNCVIAGHRDTHFHVLKDIRKGDEILLTRDGRTFRYTVDEMSIVTPDNLAPLRPTSTPVLNLITCYPFHYVGSAPKRFIVHARLENEPLRASR